MAIGSAPEYGKNFGRWGDMDDASREAWFKYMRDNWGEYLHAGYATLVHDKHNPYYSRPNPLQEVVDSLARQNDELRAEIARLNQIAQY